MTKIIPLFFISILFLNSGSGQSKFKIEGKVQGYSNGTTLYLHDLSNGSYKQIDSTIIFDDQNFLIDKNGTIIAKDVYGERLRNLLMKYL